MADSELLIIDCCQTCAVDRVQHRPVNKSADKQIGIDKTVQFYRRAKLVGLVPAQDHHLAVTGLLQPVIGNAREGHRKGKARFRHHLSGAIKNDRLGQIAKHCLVGQILVQHVRIVEQLERLAVHVIGNGQDVASDRT